MPGVAFIVTYLCSVVGVYTCAVDAEQCIRALKYALSISHSMPSVTQGKRPFALSHSRLGTQT
eukprot:SAG31_NODE_30369_length_382_cov_0.731449_1_plen_63_part_00